MTTKTADVDAEVQRRIREKLAREEAERMERIRSEVLAEQEQQRQADERAARIERLRARIAVELDRTPLNDAAATLAEAFDAFDAICAGFDATHLDFVHEIVDLAASGPVPPDLAVSPRGVISAGGRDYRPSRVQLTQMTLAYEAFRKYYPREGWYPGSPQD